MTIIDYLKSKIELPLKYEKQLQSIVAQYLVIRFVENIDDKELSKIQNKIDNLDFSHSNGLENTLKSIFSNFDQEFEIYMNDFLKENYGIIS